MELASVVAALASVGVRVSGSTPNNNIQGDSSRACPTGLAGPEPSGTHNDPGQHFQCPLTPCMTPLHHVPRTRRTEGARPLSSHDVTQIAFHYFFALPLPLPLPLPPPFLGAGAGFRI